MYKVRSNQARRGRTGRKTTNTLVRRRVQVRKHHPRRYAGAKGGRSVVHRGVTVTKARPNKSGRHRRFLGRKKPGQAVKRVRNPLGRHGHRKFHGRKKSLHKRVMRKGLHRKFKGRLYHGRHVKPGQHRRFLGRKPSTHKPRTRTPKPKAAPISSASYLSMF